MLDAGAWSARLPCGRDARARALAVCWSGWAKRASGSTPPVNREVPEPTDCFTKRTWRSIPETRLKVVRKMYDMRFGEPAPKRRSVDQLRGIEGARVRRLYGVIAGQTRGEVEDATLRAGRVGLRGPPEPVA